MEISLEAKKRLAALIEERDAPLAPLAAKIGVSQSTLWNFIYGGTKNFSKIHRLATELRISLDWIIHGDMPAKQEARAGRVADSADDDFEYPDAVMGANDRLVLREAGRCAALLARQYPDLPEDAVAAIMLAIIESLKSGKLPKPAARDKAVSKPVLAEARKLALYELGKLGK